MSLTNVEVINDILHYLVNYDVSKLTVVTMGLCIMSISSIEF